MDKCSPSGSTNFSRVGDIVSLVIKTSDILPADIASNTKSSLEEIKSYREDLKCGDFNGLTSKDLKGVYENFKQEGKESLETMEELKLYIKEMEALELQKHEQTEISLFSKWTPYELMKISETNENNQNDKLSPFKIPLVGKRYEKYLENIEKLKNTNIYYT